MSESNCPSKSGQRYHQGPTRMGGRMGIERSGRKIGMRHRGRASKSHMGMIVEIMNQDKKSVRQSAYILQDSTAHCSNK